VGAPVFRGDAGEVLRQASAVVGRPVILWEVSGPDAAVPRATSESGPAAPLPHFDLGTLRSWNVAIPVGSQWLAAQASSGAWVIAPVRSQPPAPPPDGRERRSRERLALELAGLALGLIDRRATAEFAAGTPRNDPLQELASLPAMIAHEASNPLTAARAGLQMAMESVGRWMDLGADRRLVLLDDLGQVIEDIDRATEFLRAVQDRARGALARSERFDVVRVVRSCLTLERRLLRDRGLDVQFTATVDSVYLKGDPNALWSATLRMPPWRRTPRSRCGSRRTRSSSSWLCATAAPGSTRATCHRSSSRGSRPRSSAGEAGWGSRRCGALPKGCSRDPCVSSPRPPRARAPRSP
jgi:signal transduction histidine kinase